MKQKDCDKNSFRDLDVVLTPVQKVRTLAIYISRSPQRVKYWCALCTTEGVSDKRIQPDVSTRWNSTYRMIKTAFEMKKIYNKFVSNTE